MNSPSRPQSFVVALSVLLASGALAGVPSAFGQANRPNNVPARGAPSPIYYATIASMVNTGKFVNGVESFSSQARGGIKNGLNGYWIDGICYNAMAGECYYQMGQHVRAMEYFNNALNLYVNFFDWMNLVDFPSAIRPMMNGVNQAPWAQSTRNAQLGDYRPYPIFQGRIDNRQVVEQGGVVQPPTLYMIGVQEIVRCTTLAIRRRREMLGPSSSYDDLTNRVSNALARRPGPPNHWAEAWIDVQAGVAYAAMGKGQQAKNSLERAVIAGGRFDHPLTCVALYELGRIAMDSADFATAERNFMEASISAYQYDDFTLAGEALRAWQKARAAANQNTIIPNFAAAATWAKQKNYPHLQAVAWTVAAENASAGGDPKTALTYLTAARLACARRDMINGRVGAQMNYQVAVAGYQSGDAANGNTALAAALKFQETGSHWLFHIAMVDDMYLRGTLNPRSANDLFGAVLREPAAADWRADPLECLSVIVAPRYVALEHWFDVAMERKEYERAFEIADAARRARFMATLELGGRLHTLRWLLEAPDEMLDATAKSDRNNLLTNFPAYAELSQEAERLRQTMTQKPFSATDQTAVREQTANFARMSEIAEAQEALLRQIAVGRSPAATVYPPVRTTAQLQKSLPERTALLRFFISRKGLYAFLMTDSRFGNWRVAGDAELQAQTTVLLREMRNLDQNKELTADDLKNPAWKVPAKQILAKLMEQSRANIVEMFDELIIVPDGALWYVPFEALQVDVKGEQRPLISQVRIRYAPLASMATGDPRPRRQGKRTAVAVGKLFPRDEAGVAMRAFDSLQAVLPDAQAVQKPTLAPSSLWGTLFGRLIVYNDIQPPAGNPYAWSPAGVEKTSAGNSAADWFALPWGGPEEIILPGFHTSAENALKGARPDTAGMDLFLNLTGLMSNGARTVLISRWRPGGQSSYDLVREFAQELPQTPAPEAFQRAYEIVSQQPISPEFEPRIALKKNTEPPIADHPFFWGAFMLADTGQPPVLKPTPAPGTPKPPVAAAAAANRMRAAAQVNQNAANAAPFGGNPADAPQKPGEAPKLELKDPLNVR